MEGYLGIDIGGTTIHYCLLSKEGAILKKYPSDSSKVVNGRTQIVPIVLKRISQLIGEITIKGVAIASAGVVDSETGKIIYAGATIPHYIHTHWPEIIQTKFGLKCTVINDVNAFLLGESWQGSLKEVSNAFALTVGTGIGGALLINGSVYSGVRDTAGEIGYMKVHGVDFQDLASTVTLCQMYYEVSGEYVDGQEIFRRVHQGSEKAAQVVTHWVKQLAIGLMNVMYLFSPNKIVLGGGVMAEFDYISPILQRELERLAENPLFLETEIVSAKLGDLANVMGALKHFLTVYK